VFNLLRRFDLGPLESVAAFRHLALIGKPISLLGDALHSPFPRFFEVPFGSAISSARPLPGPQAGAARLFRRSWGILCLGTSRCAPLLGGMTSRLRDDRVRCGHPSNRRHSRPASRLRRHILCTSTSSRHRTRARRQPLASCDGPEKPHNSGLLCHEPDSWLPSHSLIGSPCPRKGHTHGT